MTPSEFRKANPKIDGLALAVAYTAHIDPDGARAREAMHRWGFDMASGRDETAVMIIENTPT